MCIRDRHSVVERNSAQSSHGLRAVDEAQAFFGHKLNRRNPSSPESFISVHKHTAYPDLPFAEEGKGQVREGRKIA